MREERSTCASCRLQNREKVFELTDILAGYFIIAHDFSSFDSVNGHAGDTEFKFAFKGAVSGLRQFLATESPLKSTKYAILFHLKSSFCSGNI